MAVPSKALHRAIALAVVVAMTALASVVPAGATSPSAESPVRPGASAAHTEAPGSMSGTITDAVTHAGISGICIDAVENDGGLGSGTATSLSDGTYTIINLQPGTYSLVVSATCSHTKVSPYANVLDTNLSVSVAASATTSGVDFALVQGGAISGSVTDAATMAGLSGICVFAAPVSSGTGYASATSVNGSFTISNLQPGSYVVVVDPTCFAAVTSPYASAISVGAGQRVGSGVTTVGPSFPLAMGGSVSGRVTDVNTGAPVSGACMAFADSQGGSGFAVTTTFRDGTYSATNLAPGDYLVEINPSCNGPSIYPKVLIPIPVTITAGVNSPNNGFQLTPTDLKVVTLTGRVGYPLSLATTGGDGTGTVTYSVQDGTATGCSVSGTTLSATTSGTCIVTATKGPDVNVGPVSSRPATVKFLAKPSSARPATLNLAFPGVSSALNTSEQKSLQSLSYKLLPGASVTVTGYAKGNAGLARRRAHAVANAIKSDELASVHVTVQVDTATSKNEVSVVTLKN